MSISKMDWSRRNANGAVTHPNNQQYLPQSTSSTVQTMPSHKALVPPNSYSTAQTFSTNSASHNLILKSLLGAKSIDEIAKIQLSALAKAAPQQSVQISLGQYNPSCSSQQTMTTATNQQSSRNVQNPAVATYQMQIYPNSVLQNFQLGQQLQPMSIIQQQTQPLQILHQVLPTIQQQAQPMQQARPMPIAQQQTQPMPIVHQQMQQQSMPSVQQQMQQSMPSVQQQMQQQQQSMPNVQQQMQQQQSMPNVQQQMQQQQSMPSVQQQMQQQQSMPSVQQQMQQQQSMPNVQQQQSMPNVQQQAQPAQCCGVRYNTREVQQAPQTTQSGGYSHNNAYKEMLKTYGGKRYRKNVQISYQSVPQTNDQLIYSSPNGNSVQYIATYKAGHDNVPVSTSNYQNGQNVSVSPSNYQNGQNISVATSNFHNGQPIPTQMGSNIQQNTLQPQRDTNDYVQSPQRQVVQSLHSGFANNSSNVLPSTTVGQMPPLYSQTNTNASNVHNVSINQRLSHTNQNVQPSVQSHTAPQEQHSVTEPPPANVGNVPQDPRANVQNILALLKVYRNVKLKYLMLNRENNLLRQQMLGPSQDNSAAVKPPLISILSDSTVPSNNPIGGKDVSLNSTVQRSPPPYTQRVQTPTLYNDPNVPVQNVSQSSNSFPGHGYSTNTDLLNQRNYTSPINLGSNANSSGQTIGSGTLRDSMGSIQANNQYLPQDGLHVTSSQSHAQTSPASKSSNSVHITNKSNLYSNKPLTFGSREAIKASLPLWKSVTQSEYLEPKQPVVDSRNTIHILEESASNTINEPSSVTLTQKSEHSGPNVSKGIEPQIAIVSPLVQIKGLANEIRKLSKVVPHSEDIANSDAGGLKENDHFNKILLSLESEDAQLRSSMVFSSPCTVEGSPNCNEDQTSAKNIDMVDEDFQISGVCTLVEGNSSYDSSIAMMFEGSVQPQAGSPMTQTDLNDEHALQCSQGEEVNICDASQATSSFSPTKEVMAVKSEPEEEEIESCVNMEDDQQGENVCLQTQPENNLPASDLFDLESNTVSDQLSELLTEFPFGIKNYMSDDKDTEVSLGKFTVKTEIKKKSLPFSCDDESESIEDMQIERSMDTLTKEIESTRTKDTDQQCVVERVPTPEVPTDEGNSTQLDDDCFEICESPDDNIHITLLDQDQMNKLFPDESTEPIVNSEESLVECFAKDSEGPVGDDAVNAIKEKSHNETLSAPDKELFCCLFSWIAYTNGNAPKCNCKLTDLTVTKDLTPRFSLPAAMIKTEPSESDQEPLAENLKSPTVYLNPSLSDPCETKLDKIESSEILPPVLKRPKLEPIECALERKTDQLIGNCSPREGIQAKEYLPEKHREDQSLKDQRTNYTLTNKVLQPKSPLVDPDSMKSKDPFLHSESKDDGPPKLEKLIIKTDFLKNKHSLKTKKEKKKRKYKERKMSRDEEGGSRNIQKTYKNPEMVESAKTYKVDQRVKFGNEKIISPAGTVQHPERGVDKLKLSSRSDKSHSHSQAPSLDKRRGRRKSLPESHFEKVKNVPTVQEYLERKRELCNRRPGPKVDQKDELPEIRHRVVEKPTLETHNLLKLLTNQSKSSSLPKKHSSHEKGSLANKGADQKSTSYKDKIYLSPCDVSRQPSYEGIHLTQLQIRCSPEKPRYDERRKSPESPVQNKEAPKMLEFKLCPEFDNRSPTTQERKGEPKAVKETSVVEGIKSKKEAWCSGGPGRKSWIDSSSEDQGRHSPSQSSSVKSSSRPVQDSKATFYAFKQRFYEQRSKSLDNSL